MKEILTAWQWDGPVSEPIPYGEGHINQTYAITVTSEQGAKRYILQKINTNTFKDPAGLMENVCGVTDFLREKAKQRGADPARATLHVVPTKEEKPYYQAADGSCWRIYEFVENTVCLQQVQSAEDFYCASLTELGTKIQQIFASNVTEKAAITADSAIAQYPITQAVDGMANLLAGCLRTRIRYDYFEVPEAAEGFLCCSGGASSDRAAHRKR